MNKAIMNYSRISFYTGFFLLLILTACSSDKQENKVVVKIDKEELTLDMLKEMIPFQYKSSLTHEQIQTYIDMWVAQELMYKEAVQQGLHRQDKLFKALKKAEKDFLVESLLDSLIQKKITISEEEAREYYERNQDNYLTETTEIRALHILVETLQESYEVRNRLSAGEDFKTVAQDVSLDFKRNQRIETGYFSEEDVVPEISRIIFRYRTGSTSRALKSQFGYHIFRILEKRNPNSIRNFDEVKAKIVEKLVSEKRDDLYKNYITELRDKTNIEQNFEYLEELYVDGVQISREQAPDTIKSSE